MRVTRRSVVAGLSTSALIARGGNSLARIPQSIALPGVYLGAGDIGRSKLANYEKWLGVKVSGMLEFASYNSWEDIEHSSEYLLKRWKGFDRRLTFSIPMLPAGTSSSLELGAKGSYDATFQKIGNLLVANSLNNSVLRIGWEFNGSWFPWKAQGNPNSWVQYWRRIAHVLKSTPGSDFKFEWAPTFGVSAIHPEKLWPGADMVDIIGMSFYNDCLGSCAASADQRWSKHVESVAGLNWHKLFAAQHGKPVSFPEWATGKRPNGDGGGDDPIFIQRFIDWLGSSNLSYHNYFEYNARDFRGMLSEGQYPLSAVEFRKAFSPI